MTPPRIALLLALSAAWALAPAQKSIATEADVSSATAPRAALSENPFAATTGGAATKSVQPRTQRASESLPATGSTAPKVHQRSGIVTPARRVRLGARMNAAVATLHAKQGERFRQGDVLVEFDCSVERAALEEARIAHQLAKFNHNLKRSEAENREITKELAALAGLQAEAALAALNHARERVKYCTISAPFDARVIKVFVAEHEEVEALKPVVEIIEDTAPRFQMLLPWDWLSWLSPGHEFEVHVAGRDYRARLEHLAPEADPIDKSLTAFARILDADKKLLIGMSGVAYFPAPGDPEKADVELAR